MNWFQRHLNWTLVLSFLVVLVVAYMMAVVVVVVDPSDVREGTVGAVEEAVGLVGGLIASAWVIEQKGRSQWWLLLSGVFSALWLENKKKKQTH